MQLRVYILEFTVGVDLEKELHNLAFWKAFNDFFCIAHSLRKVINLHWVQIHFYNNLLKSSLEGYLLHYGDDESWKKRSEMYGSTHPSQACNRTEQTEQRGRSVSVRGPEPRPRPSMLGTNLLTRKNIRSGANLGATVHLCRPRTNFKSRASSEFMRHERSLKSPEQGFRARFIRRPGDTSTFWN